LQLSATVRNRSRLAVPLASSAKVVTFGGFNRCIARFGGGVKKKNPDQEKKLRIKKNPDKKMV